MRGLAALEALSSVGGVPTPIFLGIRVLFCLFMITSFKVMTNLELTSVSFLRKLDLQRVYLGWLDLRCLMDSLNIFCCVPIYLTIRSTKVKVGQ